MIRCFIFAFLTLSEFFLCRLLWRDYDVCWKLFLRRDWCTRWVFLLFVISWWVIYLDRLGFDLTLGILLGWLFLLLCFRRTSISVLIILSMLLFFHCLPLSMRYTSMFSLFQTFLFLLTLMFQVLISCWFGLLHHSFHYTLFQKLLFIFQFLLFFILLYIFLQLGIWLLLSTFILLLLSFTNFA